MDSSRRVCWIVLLEGWRRSPLSDPLPRSLAGTCWCLYSGQDGDPADEVDVVLIDRRERLGGRLADQAEAIGEFEQPGGFVLLREFLIAQEVPDGALNAGRIGCFEALDQFVLAFGEVGAVPADQLCGLRTILEGAAGNVLAAGLLTLWHG